jgi:hypothetical protein
MNEHSAIVWTAVVAALATIATGIIAFFGGKNSATALIQQSINQGFSTLASANHDEIIQLRGEIQGLKQYIRSLENVLRAQGLELPEHRMVEVVFQPFPEGTTNG